MRFEDIGFEGRQARVEAEATETHMLFASRLRDLRMEKGLSQKEAAEKLGLRPNVLSGYESKTEGGFREPNFGYLKALAQFYNVSIDYLLGQSDEREYDYYKISTTLNLDKESAKKLENVHLQKPALNFLIQHETFINLLDLMNGSFDDSALIFYLQSIKKVVSKRNADEQEQKEIVEYIEKATRYINDNGTIEYILEVMRKIVDDWRDYRSQLFLNSSLYEQELNSFMSDGADATKPNEEG